MKTITDSAVLPCTPDVFWRTFLDEAFAKALYLEELGFRSYKILEVGENARKTLCSPKMNLPGPLAKLVGDSFAYEEHGTLDRARGEWTWKMLQPAGSDGKHKKGMVTTYGKMRVTAEGDAACRRHDEVVAEAHVFGLGGMIESTIEKEVRASWTKERAFMTRWLQKAAG